MTPVALIALTHQAAILKVGDGKPYSRIEAALAAAAPGTEIDVYPSSSGYPKTALQISKPIKLKGMGRIELNGDGYVYSGQGQTPRAIVQFNPGSNGSSIEGFCLKNAHNESFNGAGIRITEANDIQISDCEICGNDMGVMSSGKDEVVHSGENQQIDHCTIHDNGNKKDPGLNHNLYLGGQSVYLDHCHIYGALTGHNLKSRAHLTMVTNCEIYGGSNRQIDCVDSWFTQSPNSDLVVFNSILATDPNSVGNGNVIHFGQESGKRDGCVFLYNSSIYTEFLTPVIQLDTPLNRAKVDDCLVVNPDPITPQFVKGPSGNASGSNDMFSVGFDLSGFHRTGTLPTFFTPVSTRQAISGVQATGFGPKVQATLPAHFFKYDGWEFVSKNLGAQTP